MKYSCEVVKDLMPIYIDNVCSEESREVVKEHMVECEKCREYLSELKSTESIEASVNNFEEEHQVESLKSVKKKMKKRTTIIVIAAAIGGVILQHLIVGGIALGLVAFSNYTAKVETYTDIRKYEELIGENAKEEFRGKWGMDETILPAKITQDMNVKEFSLTYYNPWDAQFVTYLTVEYNEKDYNEEIKRLEAKGVEKYEGYYSVTGEPNGYDIVAMDSDDYQGFVYALIPENGKNTVTYVEIIFCNYFLDLDINKYLPKEYLLSGFDATSGNPYEKEQMKKK